MKPSPFTDSHTIELNSYQVANLRAALEACHAGSFSRPNPLNAIDSGDWLGEILFKLPQVAQPPNRTSLETVKLAKDWTWK